MSENRHANGTANMAWSSHIGFLLACVGAAIGLGNIWKFPYMAGTQGGGAFVLIYLVTIFLIAIPVAACGTRYWPNGAAKCSRLRHLSCTRY
jgi:NSS family neurotransmitter:Na+ symporter